MRDLESLRETRGKNKRRKTVKTAKKKRGNWGRRWAVGAAFVAGLARVATGNGAWENAPTEERAETRGWRSWESWEKSGKTRGSSGTAETPKADENRLIVVELRPGDMLATRWGDEKRNRTPGFWNHLAVVGTDGRSVVEAQRLVDGAISTPINDFLARYSEVAVFRFFDAETARRAAAFAENRVAIETIPTILRTTNGEKRANGEGEWKKRGDFDGGSGVRSGPRYAWNASLTPILRSDAAAENCVSLVRRAFFVASGVDYGWKTPDDLARWDKSGDFARIGRF